MTTPSTFALLVRFDVMAKHVAEFDALVAETLVEIRAEEPDTLIYVTNSVRQQSTQRVFYEVYRDRAAFDRHELSPHIQHFVQQRGYYLASPVDVTWLTPIDGLFSR